MAVSLFRQVLNRFEDNNRPLTLTALARDLDISKVMLEEILQYWVKKGKLREVSFNDDNCSSCGIESSCPFVVTMPRMFEIASKEDDIQPPQCCCQ